MGNTLAEVAVVVRGDDRPLKNTITKLGGYLTARLGAIGAAAGTAFSSAFTMGATAGLAALAGGFGFGALATKLASDAEEAASKFSFVFKGAAAKTIEELDAFAKAAGRSKFGLRSMAADIGALIGPMGFTAKKTGELSVQVVKLAQDLSSFFNVSENDALIALRAGLVGESEPLRRLGVQLNEAKIQGEAFRLGLAKTKQEITGAAKAQAILSIITRETKDAQGDAIRTAGGFANSFRALQGVLYDIGVEVGQLFLPAATKIVQTLRGTAGFLRGATVEFKRWGETIGEITGNVLAAIRDLAARVAGVIASVSNAIVERLSGGMVKSFGDAVTKILDLAAVLTTDFGETWKLISLGGQLAWAELSGRARIAWANITGWARIAWNEIKIATLSGVNEVRAIVVALAAGLRGAFTSMVEDFQNSWAGMAVRMYVEFQAAVVGIAALVVGLEQKLLKLTLAASGIGGAAADALLKIAAKKAATANEAQNEMVLSGMMKFEQTKADLMAQYVKQKARPFQSAAASFSSNFRNTLENERARPTGGFGDVVANAKGERGALQNELAGTRTALTAQLETTRTSLLGQMAQQFAAMTGLRDSRKAAAEQAKKPAGAGGPVLGGFVQNLLGNVGKGVAGLLPDPKILGVLGKAGLDVIGKAADNMGEQKPARHAEFVGLADFNRKIQSGIAMDPEKKNNKQVAEGIKMMVKQGQDALQAAEQQAQKLLKAVEKLWPLGFLA